MKEAFADDTEDSAKYMEQAKYDMDEWNKKYTK